MLKVKVVPGSSRTRIDGWLGGSLKIRVTAQPEKGRANDAVGAVLAEALAIPKSEVSLSSGSSSARKTFKINKLSDDEIYARLSAHGH
jgi:hypothetical protein